YHPFFGRHQAIKGGCAEMATVSYTNHPDGRCLSLHDRHAHRLRSDKLAQVGPPIEERKASIVLDDSRYATKFCATCANPIYVHPEANNSMRIYSPQVG